MVECTFAFAKQAHFHTSLPLTLHHFTNITQNYRQSHAPYPDTVSSSSRHLRPEFEIFTVKNANRLYVVPPVPGHVYGPAP